MEHGALGRADALERLEHRVVGVAVVDLHRDPVLLRDARCAPRSSRTGRRGRLGSVRKKSSPVSPTARTRGSAASSSITASASSSSPGCRVARRLVGVDGDRGEHPRLGWPRSRPTSGWSRGRRRPARRRATPTLDARSSCSGQSSVGVPRSPSATRGGCGCRRPATVSGLGQRRVLSRRLLRSRFGSTARHALRAGHAQAAAPPPTSCSMRGNSGSSGGDLTCRRGSTLQPPASRIGWSASAPSACLGAERGPQLRGRGRHHRREQHREGAQSLGRRVEHGAEALALARRPWPAPTARAR